jgi:hypothetical protein
MVRPLLFLVPPFLLVPPPSYKLLHQGNDRARVL